MDSKNLFTTHRYSVPNYIVLINTFDKDVKNTLINPEYKTTTPVQDHLYSVISEFNYI